MNRGVTRWWSSALLPGSLDGTVRGPRWVTDVPTRICIMSAGGGVGVDPGAAGVALLSFRVRAVQPAEVDALLVFFRQTEEAYRTMRAVRIAAPNAPLRAATLPDLPPAPGQVRIEVKACGICHSDAHYRAGRDGKSARV